MKVSTTNISCLLVLSVLVIVYLIFHGQTWWVRSASFAESSKLLQKDKLDGGLIADKFDESSCLSRYKSFSYRKLSPHNPSSYLLSRLRNYEDLHKRCGPNTKSYNESVKNMEKSSHEIDSSTECKYVVWMSFSGLGNRILTLTSAFLYALVTNRVLLVDEANEIDDLFCEPFPQTSWLLPLDFPVMNQSLDFNRKTNNTYGNMIQNNVINMSTKSLPWYLFIYLTHDYGDHDKAFFCDQDQALLANVPWLIVKTNNYFVPALFMIPSFEQELSKLFPEAETVFHHLGRYLFHPSNHVWGIITRYHHAYLANADEKIGIQIRNYDTGPGPFKYVMDQIMDCTSKEKLLPQVTDQKSMIIINSSKNIKSIAVLVTSLKPGYFENLKNMYLENPTTTGEVIGVYQPSHEEVQHSEIKMHNRKALTEMFLLSFTDVLVTSGWSTFGYVAQGIGGLRPWIMYRPVNRKTPNPPCRRAMSMEPCFHAPPYLDCKTKKRIKIAEFVPPLKNCEDVSRGLKLADSFSE